MQISSTLRCSCGTLFITQRRLYQFHSQKYDTLILGCKPCWTQDASAKHAVMEYRQDNKDKLTFHKASH